MRFRKTIDNPPRESRKADDASHPLSFFSFPVRWDMPASLPGQQTARGVRWGELFLGLGFVLLNIVAALLTDREGTHFYIRFWFAWMIFAAFVGMTRVLIPTMGIQRILRHACVSLVILAGVGFRFLNQHFLRFSETGTQDNPSHY